MRFTAFSLTAFIILAPTAAFAVDPIVVPAIVTPVSRGGTYHPNSYLVGNGYFYGEFASQLQALQNERDIANAELDLINRRVESFRPFHSFGPYGATYFVDQAWQIEQLAARQRLQQIDLCEADLWRQRRAAAEALAIATARAARR
jgi:hypothetical protein